MARNAGEFMFSLVILAAGKSERFGENKLLVNVLGEPLIRRVVKNALNSRVDEVIVVLGYMAEEIEKILRDLPCKTVLNENFEEGMSSSVKKGLSKVSKEAEAVLILPGDYPLVTAEDINKVISKFKETRAEIVIASYKGKPGHPILFSRKLFDEIKEIREEEQGLKAVVHKRRRKIILAETGSPGVLIDIDTKEDLAKLSNS